MMGRNNLIERGNDVAIAKLGILTILQSRALLSSRKDATGSSIYKDMEGQTLTLYDPKTESIKTYDNAFCSTRETISTALGELTASEGPFPRPLVKIEHLSGPVPGRIYSILPEGEAYLSREMAKSGIVLQEQQMKRPLPRLRPAREPASSGNRHDR